MALHFISQQEAERLTSGIEPEVICNYEWCKLYTWNLPDGREVSYSYDVNDEGSVMTDNYYLIDNQPIPRLAE